MLKIAHRGNTDGPNSESENHPAQINLAISQGFDCEIDVWLINGHFLLGHDEPAYSVKEKFLENSKLWCHAKNLPALDKMLKNNKVHCFWHENDDYTITSKGFIWTFPGKSITKQSVIVDLQPAPNFNLDCYGICADTF